MRCDTSSVDENSDISEESFNNPLNSYEFSLTDAVKSEVCFFFISIIKVLSPFDFKKVIIKYSKIVICLFISIL